MQEVTKAADQVPIEFSVLIGLVSSEDRRRIFEVLDAIKNQSGAQSLEVILVDRTCDEIGEAIDQAYQQVRRIKCPALTSLPAMRALALHHATGKYVVVTEDHCVPDREWLNGFLDAFAKAPDHTVAVAGCVNNGVDETAFDRATFFCEYSAFYPPVEEGATRDIPGMNVAYLASALKQCEQEGLSRGFWETTIHPDLQKNGLGFYLSNKIKVAHSKKFSFGLFIQQRFLYSRYYASLRYPPEQVFTRWGTALATVLLPFVLLLRSIGAMHKKRALNVAYLSAIPFLFVFYLVWATGEACGYIFGSGDSLSRIE